MELRYRLRTYETPKISLEINIADSRPDVRGRKHRHGRKGCHHKDGHMNEHHHRRGRGHRHGHQVHSEGGPVRRRRILSGDQLRLVLLHLVGQQPRHGYDLIREIEAITNGAYVPSAGVVYPALSLLADMGHATASDDGEGRKMLDITDAGRTALHGADVEVKLLLERLASLGAAEQKVDGGPVRRAMHNLKAAMRGRLASEDVDHDTLLKAAAILDEAAARIERL